MIALCKVRDSKQYTFILHPLNVSLWCIQMAKAHLIETTEAAFFGQNENTPS